MSDDAEAALAATFREEWPRLVAAALRIAGDLQTAEDAAQDSFLAALDTWALAGVPERPGAWLMTVCRNRARNAVRDAGRVDQKARSLRPLLAGHPSAGNGPRGIADDRLRLIAMCCHSLLSTNAQVALTLRMVAGLTTEEIARGFHTPIPTVAQRIARAKRVLTEHKVTFTSDDPVVHGPPAGHPGCHLPDLQRGLPGRRGWRPHQGRSCVRGLPAVLPADPAHPGRGGTMGAAGAGVLPAQPVEHAHR